MKVGVSQLAALHGILQRGGQRLLPYHGVERRRAVFSRRNNIFFHIFFDCDCKIRKKIVILQAKR